jgi:RimJ/RimL family protein N-acetyltransferase
MSPLVMSQQLPIIETPRLTARLPQMRDAAGLAALMTEGISKWVAAWPYPLGEEEARSILGSVLNEAEASRCRPFAVEERVSQRLEGWLKVEINGSSVDTCELGYWIGEEFQGRGYAGELGRAALEFAFSKLAAERVVAGAQLENRASLRLLARLGMKRSHVKDVWASARQRFEPCEFWAIDRSNWARL